MTITLKFTPQTIRHPTRTPSSSGRPMAFQPGGKPIGTAHDGAIPTRATLSTKTLPDGQSYRLRCRRKGRMTAFSIAHNIFTNLTPYVPRTETRRKPPQYPSITIWCSDLAANRQAESFRNVYRSKKKAGEPDKGLHCEERKDHPPRRLISSPLRPLQPQDAPEPKLRSQNN